MNVRQQQLREHDVRRTAPELDPVSFLSMYLKSNFPQTASHRSPEQKLEGIFPQADSKDVNYTKKPLSGTSFDNPASY
jgi:hypothetical protein